MKDVNHSPALIAAINLLLSEAPAGLSEYELMEALDKRYPELFPKPDFGEKILLFQHHFMLRHCLYRLQNDYANERLFQLEIGLVNLVKRPSNSENQQISHHDPLRDYYLDLSNINKESEASIDGLLNSFWTRLTDFIAAPDAHKILGLTGHETAKEKQKRYRQLAQQHHPDKGGNAETFNEIQHAWRSIRHKT